MVDSPHVPLDRSARPSSIEARYLESDDLDELLATSAAVHAERLSPFEVAWVIETATERACYTCAIEQDRLVFVRVMARTDLRAVLVWSVLFVVIFVLVYWLLPVWMLPMMLYDYTS